MLGAGWVGVASDWPASVSAWCCCAVLRSSLALLVLCCAMLCRAALSLRELPVLPLWLCSPLRTQRRRKALKAMWRAAAGATHPPAAPVSAAASLCRGWAGWFGDSGAWMAGLPGAGLVGAACSFSCSAVVVQGLLIPTADAPTPPTCITQLLPRPAHAPPSTTCLVTAAATLFSSRHTLFKPRRGHCPTRLACCALPPPLPRADAVAVPRSDAPPPPLGAARPEVVTVVPTSETAAGAGDAAHARDGQPSYQPSPYTTAQEEVPTEGWQAPPQQGPPRV